MYGTIGLPVPSPVSCCLGLSVVLPGWIYVMYSLVSNPCSCMDFVSDFCYSWLDFLDKAWTWLIILACLGLSRRPVTNPALPKSCGTAPWLVRALPCLSCGQPRFPAYLPSLSGPALVHDMVHQDLHIHFSVSPQSILLWWLFRLR